MNTELLENLEQLKKDLVLLSEERKVVLSHHKTFEHVEKMRNAVNKSIELLKNGLTKLKDKKLKYRTHFVLGQIYLELGKFEKANNNFIKVLKLNAPYQYVFQANLGMAKSTASNNGQGAQKTRKYLKRMLDDNKNTEYFDQIYYELAKLEFKLDNESD